MFEYLRHFFASTILSYRNSDRWLERIQSYPKLVLSLVKNYDSKSSKWKRVLFNAYTDNWNIYGAGHSFCNILPSAPSAHFVWCKRIFWAKIMVFYSLFSLPQESLQFNLNLMKQNNWQNCIIFKFSIFCYFCSFIRTKLML